MTTSSSKDFAHLPYVKRYENSDWTSYNMSIIRRFLQSNHNYQIYRCFYEFSDGNYGDSFQDIQDRMILR